MRIYNLAHELASKFAPIDEISGAQLQDKAATAYSTLLTEAQEKQKRILENTKFNDENAEKIANEKIEAKVIEKLSVKDKLIIAFEHPFAQYAFMIAFIWLVPKIKAYINGETSSRKDEDYDDQDEFDSFREFYEQYKKMKRR